MDIKTKFKIGQDVFFLLNNEIRFGMVTNSQNALHAWRILDSSERRKKLSEANKKRNFKQSNGKIITQNRLFDL